MNDAELSRLTPKTQEAVQFIQHWILAKNIGEFLESMGWPNDVKGRAKANAMRRHFTKHGVPNLKKFRKGDRLDPGEYDYLTLQTVSDKAIASLARRAEEAQVFVNDLEACRLEAARILGELRKFKDKAIIWETMKGQ